MTNAMRKIALAAVVFGSVAGLAGRAEAALALQFTSATPGAFGLSVTAGFSFTTNSAVTVAALDYILPGNAGGNVRLYDATGTTLASATVLSSDPTESTGGFTYNVHALSMPLALAANTTYYVAGDLPAQYNKIPNQATGVMTDPAITYGAGVLLIGSFGNPTTDADGGIYNPAYFSVNLDLGAPVAAVPEPAPIALALSAVPVGLVVAWRRRRARLAA